MIGDSNLVSINCCQILIIFLTKIKSVDSSLSLNNRVCRIFSRCSINLIVNSFCFLALSRSISEAELGRFAIYNGSFFFLNFLVPREWRELDHVRWMELEDFYSSNRDIVRVQSICPCKILLDLIFAFLLV